MAFHKRIKRNIPKLFKFAIVGSIGAVINLTVYLISSNILGLSLNLGAICSFFIAVCNNYVLNHFWTFSNCGNNDKPSFRQFAYYILGNILGLTINLAVLNIVVSYAGVSKHLIGQMFGIFMGMLSNFIFAKKLVFNKIMPNQLE